MRKPFQGICNIVRFNWPFYVLSIGFLLLLLLLANYLDQPVNTYFFILAGLLFLPIFISLSVSYYVYDLSGLYKLSWIQGFNNNEKISIININAGFDEVSILLNMKFKNATLVVLDFYDPLVHTENSIKRARKAYPPFAGTRHIETTNIAVPDNSADKIVVIFCAHEIRNEQERIEFFKQLKRILKPTGQIIVTEHLRDAANFFAYNIGFFHFYSKATWLTTFETAALTIEQEQKITPFISTFTLTKHGVTP